MSKPESGAINSLEFYNKQKKWKVAHSRKAKKKSAKVKKEVLDTTYEVPEGASQSLHNEAFYETGPTNCASDLEVAVFDVTHASKDAEPIKGSQPLTKEPQKTVPKINQDLNSNYVDINSNYSNRRSMKKKIIPAIHTKSRLQDFLDAVKKSNDDLPECDSVFYTNPVVANELYGSRHSVTTDEIWPPQFAPVAESVTVYFPDDKQHLLLQDLWIQMQGAAGIGKPNGDQLEYPFQQPSDPPAYPELNQGNPQYLGNFPIYRQQYGNNPPYPKDPQHLGNNQPYHNPLYPNDQKYPQYLGNNSPYLQQQLDNPPYPHGLENPPYPHGLENPPYPHGLENPPYPQKMGNSPPYQQSGSIPAYPNNPDNLQNSGNNPPYPQQLGNDPRYPNDSKYPQCLENYSLYPQNMGNTPPYQQSGNILTYQNNPENPLNMGNNSPYPLMGNSPPYQPSGNILTHQNNPEHAQNNAQNNSPYPQKMGNSPPYQLSGNILTHQNNPENPQNMGNNSPYPQRMGNSLPYQPSGNILTYQNNPENAQNMGNNSPYPPKMGKGPPYQPSGNITEYLQNMGNNNPMYQHHLRTDQNNPVNPNNPPYPNEPKDPQTRPNTQPKPDENFLKNLLRKSMDLSLNMGRTSEFGGGSYDDQGPKRGCAMGVEWEEEFCSMSGAHRCLSSGSLHSDEFMLGAHRAAHSSEVDLARLLRATPMPHLRRDVTCPGRGRGRGRLTARDREAGLMLLARRGRM